MAQFSWNQKPEPTDEIQPTKFSWSNEKTYKANRQSGQVAAEARQSTGALNIAKNTLLGIPSRVADQVIKPVVTGAVDGWKAVTSGKRDIKNTPDNIRASVDAAAKQWGNTLVDTSERFNEAYDAWAKDKSALDKTTATASAGLGVVNIFFAPITAALKSVSGVPVIGAASDTVERVFSAIGTSSGNLAVAQLEQAPIAPESKKKLEPVVRELSALVGMIAAGRATDLTYTKVKERTNTVLTELKSLDPQAVAQAADRTPGVGTNAPRKLEVKDESDPRAVTGLEPTQYEPYPQQLPVIEFGSRGKSKEPVIQIGEKAPRASGDLTIEPIKPGTFSWSAEPKETLLPKEAPLKSGQFQSETSLKLKEESAARGIDVGDIPVQTSRVKTVDRAKSDEFVKSDKEAAVKIMEGVEQPPKDMLWADIYKSLERVAIETRDVDLVTRLSKVTEQSRIAQELQALNREFDLAANPIAAARDIAKARASLKTKETKKLRQKSEPIQKPTKQTFADFIQSITC